MGYLKYAIVAISAGLLSTGAAAAALADYIVSAEIALSDQPEVALPFKLEPVERTAHYAGSLALLLGDSASEPFVEASHKRYILQIQPKDPSYKVTVRARAVTFMNLGDDGPHWPVTATEQRGPWRSVTSRGVHSFEVGEQPVPLLQLTKDQLMRAVRTSEVGRDSRWIAVARRCAGADQAPCYTVTDSEYEVTVSNHGRTLARGVLRLKQPDGC